MSNLKTDYFCLQEYDLHRQIKIQVIQLQGFRFYLNITVDNLFKGQ